MFALHSKMGKKKHAVTEQINVRVDEIPNLLFIFQFQFLIKGRNRDKKYIFSHCQLCVARSVAKHQCCRHVSEPETSIWTSEFSVVNRVPIHIGSILLKCSRKGHCKSFIQQYNICALRSIRSGLEVIKLFFSCSTQLSMKF